MGETRRLGRLSRRIEAIVEKSLRASSVPVGRRSVASTMMAGTLGLLGASLLCVVGPSAAAGGSSSSLSLAAEGPGEGISFEGQVVDLETGHPLEGVSIVVDRSVPGLGDNPPPPWAGKSTLRTDAKGRFSLTFPPEQVATPRLAIGLSVAHPAFVRRKRNAFLAELIRGRTTGDRPFFETVALERGIEYFGRVVTPEGGPAADVSYDFSALPGSHSQPRFSDDMEGRTDSEGNFRVRMPRTRRLIGYLTPDRYAPLERLWGTDNIFQNPDVWVSPDLGRLVLEPGVVLSGRMVDLRGRPMAGHRVATRGRSNPFRRIAVTGKDGRFTFAPLRPGTWSVDAEDQDFADGNHPSITPIPPSPPVFRTAYIELKEGDSRASVLLRELPAVTLEVRFVDSRGRPVLGGSISLSGTLPAILGRGAKDSDLPKIPPLAIDEGRPAPSDVSMDWGCRLFPHVAGAVLIRVPKGLRDVSLSTYPFDEGIAYKTRLEDGGALKFWGGGRLGTLEADRKGITIIAFRAPTVLMTVQTAGGEPLPDDVQVGGSFQYRGSSFGGSFTRQADGRFRSQGLMPEHEYTYDVHARGYFPAKSGPISLPEGGSAELTLVLKRQPDRVPVGGMAPGFSVKTLDGGTLTLEGLRGKFVLLEFWEYWNEACHDELPHLKRIHERFGQDDRFAMVGLAASFHGLRSRNPNQVAATFIKDKGLSWPHSSWPAGQDEPGFVPDAPSLGKDALAAAYGVMSTPSIWLIGPDGKVVARDLRGPKIEEAVSEALGRR